MSDDPVIDARTAKDVIAEAQALRSVYTPEWTQNGDSGSALISIFARLMEIMISRLNRVPEKNFLAFLDTAGVRLLPPKAARAPVKFVATSGAKKDGVVPPGTQLGTAPPPGQEPLTFETEKGLTVSRSRLAHLYSHNPAADQYADQQAVVTLNEKNESAIFQPFAGSLLIPHRLYLSQDTVFRINHPTKLTLLFKVDSTPGGVSLLQGLEWKIRSGQNDIRPISAVTTVNMETLTVVLDGLLLNTINNTKVDGADGHWIQAETKNALTPNAAKVKVLSLTVTSEAAGIKPSLAFFNATALDLEREFYPFGERPKKFDTCFIAIPEALNKAGSTVTLVPTYTRGVAGTFGVGLTYEFWSGTAWQTLGVSSNTSSSVGSFNEFKDTTKAFTADSSTGIHIQFTCPSMKLVEVNSKKDYWLRVRITSGDYGKDAAMALTAAGQDKLPQFRTLSDWTYTPPSFAPPIITSLSASYAYTSEQKISACRTENNFAFASVDPTGAFQPFAAPSEDQPACYLGFDSTFSPNNVSLYIAVEEMVLTAEPRVVWEYWDGARWKNLGVQDGTKNFTESGMVEFTGPADANKRVLFNKEAYWLRARLEQGDKALTRILGIYLNTVWAKNSVTLTNELLGSSTETPNASFKLSRYPVLDGLQIEVREPERPSDEDLKILFDEEGDDAVSSFQEGESAVREIWVRWHRVDHFRFSSKKSRHYIADWYSGRVQFGDAIRGMAPPAGRGNIRAKWYQAGGGTNGNVARNTVNVLKRAIPFVDKAFNVDAAGGGSDGETVDQVKVRGPQTIKNRNRAVTWEDYEWLAREASFQVARARCLPAKSKDDAGSITLILVPRSDDMKPYPSQGLIKQVTDWVSPRSRRIATAELVITGPKYVEISITAKVIPDRLEEADLVRQRVKAALTEFFHPLRGGPDRNGWEFGRDVFVSEVSKIIEDTEGVNHAEDVEICSSFYDDGRAAISMPPGNDLARLLYQVDVGDEYLVASGDHRISIDDVFEPNLSVFFLGNRNTKELHNLRNQQTSCRIGSIDPDHRRDFPCLGLPIREGYDFCAWCFGRDLSRH